MLNELIRISTLANPTQQLPISYLIRKLPLIIHHVNKLPIILPICGGEPECQTPFRLPVLASYLE
jgi:hypothetical protein